MSSQTISPGHPVDGRVGSVGGPFTAMDIGKTYASYTLPSELLEGYQTPW